MNSFRRGSPQIFLLGYPDFKFAWMYDELEKNMKQELDFKTEAENCRKIGKFFKDNNVKNILDIGQSIHL